MKLTVLGSGATSVGSRRAASAYLVHCKQPVLLDLGYDAFKNLQDAINPLEINTILFSHFHPDHVLDLVAFLQHRYCEIKYMGAQPKQLNLLGPQGFRDFYKKIIEAFPFLGHLQFKVVIEELGYGRKKLLGCEVESKPVKHGNTIGFRLNASGKTIAYGADSEYCDALVDLGRNADLLILECTCLDGAQCEGHLRPSDCAKIAQQANPKKLLVSHLTSKTEKVDFKKIIGEKYKGRVLVARDLMEIEV